MEKEEYLDRKWMVWGKDGRAKCQFCGERIAQADMHGPCAVKCAQCGGDKAHFVKHCSLECRQAWERARAITTGKAKKQLQQKVVKELKDAVNEAEQGLSVYEGILGAGGDVVIEAGSAEMMASLFRLKEYGNRLNRLFMKKEKGRVSAGQLEVLLQTEKLIGEGWERVIKLRKAGREEGNKKKTLADFLEGKVKDVPSEEMKEEGKVKEPVAKGQANNIS